MNDRYEHMFRKSHEAKRGGHDAWAVQSIGEKVTVALVLNRADWLAEIGYTIPEAIGRSGAEWVNHNSPGCPPARRGGMKATQIVTFHNICRTLGITAASALVLVLLGTETGRNALVRLYLQSTEAITNAIHIHTFPLDRFDPTCPQCM
jgi:hypothetical protein